MEERAKKKVKQFQKISIFELITVLKFNYEVDLIKHVIHLNSSWMFDEFSGCSIN